MSIQQRQVTRLARSFLVFAMVLLTQQTFASGAITEVREVDVTPYSYALVVRWNEAATLTVETFDDLLASSPATATVEYNYTDGDVPSIGNVARLNGLLRARVMGLEPNSAYFYRVTITPDSGNPAVTLPVSGPLNSVRTAVSSTPVNNPSINLSHVDLTDQPLDGTMVLLDVGGGAHALSQLTGDGFTTGAAVVNLNNVYDAQNQGNLQLSDGSGIQIESAGGSLGTNDTSSSLAAGEVLGVPWTLPSSPIMLAPLNDTDGDGMPDDFETQFGLDPGVDDAAGDLDGDGLTNLEEYQLGTNPSEQDTDGDGLSDGDETTLHGTLANEADTDQDGLNDGDELNVHSTDALDSDSDDDGVSDGDEIDLGGDPNDPLNIPLIDGDGDGIGDDVDNCLIRPNPDQLNTDGDAFGDACDDDDDNDGIDDENDNAPLDVNADQSDVDGDGVGDVADNCIDMANSNQANTDGDVNGDVCDDDDDNDGVNDYEPFPFPTDQPHLLTHIVSFDGDTVDAQANPLAAFALYKRLEGSGGELIQIGLFNAQSGEFTQVEQDVADLDSEGYLVIVRDIFGCNCTDLNGNETISLTTSAGPVTIYLQESDSWPQGVWRFVASDGSLYGTVSSNISPAVLLILEQAARPLNALDNCQYVFNPDQLDSDGDGLGDLCDGSPEDLDGDGILNVVDNCPDTHNISQADADSDGMGNECDLDADNDGLSNVQEAALNSNPLAADTNGDGINDANEDFDFDGLANGVELSVGSDPLSAQISLDVGLNLIQYGVEVPAGLSAYDLLEELGGSGVVESIERIDPATGDSLKVSYDNGLPTGTNFSVEGGRGYLVTMLQSRLHDWGAVIKCRSISLAVGKNLVGLGCVPNNLDSFDVLTEFGAANVVALESVDSSSRRFNMAGFDNGQVVGEQFKIDGTEAVIAHAEQNVTTDAYNLPSPLVLLNDLADGTIVSESVLNLSGSSGSLGDFITINGVAVVPSANPNSSAFTLDAIPLVEGVNQLVIRALGANGLITESTINVTYAVPPVLTVDSHFDGQQVVSQRTTVQGTVSDPTATVVVNGVAAVVTGNEFVAADVLLVDGDNPVTIVATGSNGGVATQVINLVSSPIFHVLTTPSVSSGLATYAASFTLELPESIYTEAETWSIVDGSPSFITFQAESLTSTPPQTWRYDYRVTVNGNSDDYRGLHDFVVTYRIFNAASEVIREDDIRFRIGVVRSRPYIVFDQDYDLSTVTENAITISGQILGRVTSLSIGGIDSGILGSGGSYRSSIPFSVDVPLVLGENFIDLDAFPTSLLASELVIFFDPGDPLSVDVVSPKARDVFDVNSLQVDGIVSDVAATVRVNNEVVSVTPDGDGGGTFTTPVDLVEGNNTIEVLATLGDYVAAKNVRVVKGPFAFHINTYNDYDTVNKRNLPYSGTASVPLTSVSATIGSTTRFGTIEDMTNWQHYPSNGQSPFFDANEDGFQRVTFVATAATGESVTTSLLMRYAPIELDLPYVYRGEAQFEFVTSMSQSTIDQIAYWKYGSGVATPPDVMWNPVNGRMTGTVFEHLGGGRVRLTADHEIHGSRPPGQYNVSSQNFAFFDADDNALHNEQVDLQWNLGDATSKEVFITSYSDQQVINHWVADLFGVLGNIEAQEVRMNGEVINFNETEFWDDEDEFHDQDPNYFTGVGLQQGPNDILIEVDTIDGETYSEAITLIYEPKRYTLTLGQSRTLTLRLHQRDPDNFSINMFSQDRPNDYVSYSNPSSFGTASNNTYIRPNPLADYFIHTYRPSIQYNSPVIDGFNDQGIWDFYVQVNGNFDRRNAQGIWLNLIDPTRTVPDVEVISHTDSQTVSSGSLDMQFRIPNDGFATLTVNGVETTVDYVREPDDCLNGFACQPGFRIIPTYSAVVPISSGSNVIQLDSIGSTGEVHSETITLIGAP